MGGWGGGFVREAFTFDTNTTPNLPEKVRLAVKIASKNPKHTQHKSICMCENCSEARRWNGEYSNEGSILRRTSILQPNTKKKTTLMTLVDGCWLRWLLTAVGLSLCVCVRESMEKMVLCVCSQQMNERLHAVLFTFYLPIRGTLHTRAHTQSQAAPHRIGVVLGSLVRVIEICVSICVNGRKCKFCLCGFFLRFFFLFFMSRTIACSPSKCDSWIRRKCQSCLGIHNRMCSVCVALVPVQPFMCYMLFVVGSAREKESESEWDREQKC